MILYELIAGRVPFDGSLAAVLEQVRGTPPLPPCRFRPDVPGDLETICLKCLNKEAEHRYLTAGDLADDLRRFLADRPIQGRRLSVFQKFVVWAQQPDRLRDAGLYVIAVNGVLVLWMIWNSTLIAFEQHDLAAYQRQFKSFRPQEVTAGAIAIALTTHVPLMAIGWQTLRRKRWAVHLGTVLSAAPIGLVAADWSNVITLFGGLYEDPRVRTTIYSMLLLLFASQLAAYLIAEAAVRRLKR